MKKIVGFWGVESIVGGLGGMWGGFAGGVFFVFFRRGEQWWVVGR